MAINENKLDSALKLIDGAIADGIFPGCAVSVGTREKLCRKAVYGYRCVHGNILPVEGDTLFDMASLTKVVAATSLFMVLLESGLISLYDRVGEYLEGFDRDGKEDVCIINLLTHTSGLPAYSPLYKLCSSYDDAVEYICSMKMEYKTGSRVVYSDLGYIILGRILEIVGFARLDVLCSRYVFGPLGMVNTLYNPETENVAATEAEDSTGRPLVGICHDENARSFGGISGHAGLFSNIDDVTRFTHMLINRGSILGKSSFLSKASVDAMMQNYTPGLEEFRGLGWCIKGDRISSGGDIISPSAIGHTGFTGTSMWIDMENDIYINLLTNRVHPVRSNTGIIRFRRLFHNAVMSSVG